MKDDNLGTDIAKAVVRVVVTVVAVNLIFAGATGVTNLVRKSIFDRKIKKGLKDGSIVEIDGKFYDVPKTAEKYVVEDDKTSYVVEYEVKEA